MAQQQWTIEVYTWNSKKTDYIKKISHSVLPRFEAVGNMRVEKIALYPTIHVLTIWQDLPEVKS